MEYSYTEYNDDKGKLRAAVTGVCFGYGDSMPYIIGKTAKTVTIRHPATRYWCGIGASKSYPASIVVCRILPNKDYDDPAGIRVIEVGEWEYSREPGTKRKALDAAAAKVKEIEAEPASGT